MSRRPVVALALLAAVAVSAVPAHAAKAKPKPIRASYDLTLYPDVYPDVYGQIPGKEPVCGVLPQSMDKRAFKAPAAGKLVVDLKSPDPTPAASPLHADWDLYVLDSSGAVVDSSHTEFASEQTATKLKRRTALTILVCNVTGETSGHVSYTFTYA